MRVAFLTWCFSANVAFGNKLLSTTSEASLISKAVIDVINKSFLEDISCINIVTVPGNDDVHNTIVNEVALNITSKTTIRVADLNSIIDIKEKRFYNVLLVKNYEAFHQLDRIIANELFYFQGFFLVVMTQQYENQYNDMEKIFRNMWQHFIINVNILISSSDNQLEMFTYYPYTSVHCGGVSPTLTNKFINTSFIRSHQHYGDKLKNLFGCPLRVVTFNIHPLMFVHEKPKGSKKFETSGIDGKLLRVIAKRLNFTVELISNDDEKWGALYPNGSSTGAMSMIINKKADFTIGKYTMTSLRNVFMTPSMSYFSSPLVVAVPHGEPFSSLEKLMKPFRETVWTLVMAILLITFLTIAFLKWRFNAKVQNFVFGAQNTSPYLNTLSIFLGDSLSQLPTTNFARTLLCIFMLYCLVVRNSYTGALFTFIRSDRLRHPIADSIDEMVAKDFKFYMIPSAEELTIEIPKLYERRQIIKPSEVGLIRKKLIDPSFKGGLLSSMDQIAYFNMINRRIFKVDVCKEKLFTFQYTIYFQKNSFLVPNFDLELSYYQTNGLIDHVVRKYVRARVRRSGSGRLRAIQLQQVMGCFWILCFGLTLALAVAMVELTYKKICMIKAGIQSN